MKRTTLPFLSKILFLLSLLFSSSAFATVIIVDTTIDERIINGKCSLREALEAANTNAPVDTCAAGNSGEDTVDLSGVSGAILINSPLPHVREDATVTGPGAAALRIIDDGTGSSIININSPGNDQTVNIFGLTIMGGHVLGNGGAIYVYSGDKLNLSSCTVTGNSAALDGGGIINDQGRLTLTDCIVSNNIATNRGGGIFNINGTLKLINTIVSDNLSETDHGGGIYNFSGTAYLTGSTVIANHAATNGGGIWNKGIMSLTDSTVSHNTTVNHGGGGIFNAYLGTLTLAGVTLQQNATPDWYAGGAIWNNGTMSVTASTISSNVSNHSVGGILQQGTAILTNTTISGNQGTGLNTTAATGVNTTLTSCSVAFNTGGGILSWQTTTLKNTIVARNTSYDCDYSVPITSYGSNLDGDNTCNLNGPGDLPNSNPLLDYLLDNGGPTFTHALLPGSPAINAGDNDGCPATDQRGVRRPQGGRCDIGAFEVIAPTVSRLQLLLFE